MSLSTSSRLSPITPTQSGKIQEQAQARTAQEEEEAQVQASVLRQRHPRTELIEDVLGLALASDKESVSSGGGGSSSSSIASTSSIHTASIRARRLSDMAPRPNDDELASFLPTSTEASRVRKTTMGCLSRGFRQRNKWMALSVIIFVTFQIWAWGPELKGKDRDWRSAIESWQSSFRESHHHHDHPPPPPPPSPFRPVPDDEPPPDHSEGELPRPHSPSHPHPPIDEKVLHEPLLPIPAGYEEPTPPTDDLLSLTASSSFPAKLADYYTKSHRPVHQLYPQGDPHQGIIPAHLLAKLDRDIPRIPPPRPSVVPNYPEDFYIPHSGWSAAVNGSSTTYLDALQPEKQLVEPEWRKAPFDKWQPPLQELSAKKKKTLPKVQYAFSDPSRHSGSKNDLERDNVNMKRQRLVRNAFLHSWEGYKSKAWGHDELKPVSETPEDPFNGWGATIVDALDTLLVMDLPAEYDYARQHVRDIDFHLIGGGRSAYGNSDGRIPVFETAIRYLGGFLSAYDLSGDELMRDRAEELAQLILPAFDTSSGVPVGRIRFDFPTHPSASGGVVLAEAASMLLEMTRLWQVTGNRTYFDRVQRTTDWLDRNMTNTPTRLGTLWPTTIFPDRGTMYGWYTWGGMADSAFEYLIKEHQLLGGQLEQYGRMFGEAVDSARQWLLRPVTTVSDTPLLVLGQSNGKTFEPKLEHLACFAGGSMALSGKLIPGRDRDLVHARRFTETCYWAYNSTLTGIGPESCTFYKEKDVDRHAFVFEKDGTSRRGGLNGAPIVGVRSVDSDYRNRPETIESIFYLWRTTGEPIWQERGWQMFCSWVTHSLTNVGFSSLGNVFEVPAYQTDSMESFVFAETFKYYYLLFSPPEVMSLDDYVFTTEAHPLLLPQKGVWARAGNGPRKMWDPEAGHTSRDPAVYSGGEMGPMGGLTNAQKASVYANWQQKEHQKSLAKAKQEAKQKEAAEAKETAVAVVNEVAARDET